MDDLLLDRYARGADKSALDQLVKKHIDFVYATAKRELKGDSAAADDVTQAVFLVLARKAASVPKGRLSGWLFRTTCYACADFRKQSARRIKHETIAAMERPEANPMNTTMPYSDSDSQTILQHLNDAIGSLNSVDREIIVRRFLQGSDVPSLAVDLNLSEPATYKRITRAIEKLRKKLTGYASGASVPLVVGVMEQLSKEQAPAAIQTQVLSLISNATVANASVQSLTAGAIKMFFWSKLKVAVTMLLGVLMIVGAGAVIAQQQATPVATNPDSQLLPLERLDNPNPFNIATTQPVSTPSDDAKILLTGKARWRSEVLDIKRSDGSVSKLILELEFVPVEKQAGDGARFAKVKLYVSTPTQGTPGIMTVSVSIGGSLMDLLLDLKTGVRTMTINRSMDEFPHIAVGSERYKQTQSRFDSDALVFQYEIKDDTLSLKGFPESPIMWGSSKIITPQKEIVFKLISK